MANFFNTIRITNFKSLKDVTLSDCKRINLLIGKPNVGKSNILEAIGLLGLIHSRFNKNKKLSQFVRFENTPELFFDGNTHEPITLEVNNDGKQRINKIEFLHSDHQRQLKIETLVLDGRVPTINLFVDNNLEIEEEFQFGDSNEIYAVKLYKFKPHLSSEKENVLFLVPPSGVNLFFVIQSNKQLKKDLIDIFAKYGLKLLLDNGNQSVKILKELKNDGDDVILTIPYASIADTLQRLIFFKAAIASNQDSILLFEEPEAHCFPPYIRHITQDIIDSENNQFFIATHSPYVLNDFLEYERDDFAIFMADFKDGQTVIRRLTDEELGDVYEYGLDLFFNYELFTSDDSEH